ncbi:MAG: tetratricopeptide repeat protein, partial [Holophagales bacterium]|nr:tetratricopeptide repeat protein [Holophagales bacterium]
RLGDYPAAEEQLELARDIYARLEEPRGEADVWTALGGVLWDQNDLVRAKTCYERAARLYGATGDERMRARALANRALVLRERGDLHAAIEVFGEALSALRAAGDTLAEAIVLVNLAQSTIDAGRFAEAAQAFEEATELAAGREPTIQSFVAYASGRFLALSGDLAEGKRRLEEARELQEETGDRFNQATTFRYLAGIAVDQGDLERAMDFQDRAFELLEGLGNPSAAHALLLRERGDLLLIRGDLETARRRLEHALDLQEGSTNLRPAAETRLSLAELHLEAGSPSDAEELARDSLEDLERGQALLWSARAHEVLARTRLAAGSLEAARGEIERARQLLTDVHSPAYRLPVERTAARILAAGGEVELAQRELQSSLARATTSGFAAEELETRLALAEIELEAGDSKVARTRLEQLRQEARSLGAGLLEAKAARALGRSRATSPAGGTPSPG